jgi:hypothetical protein
MEIVPMRYAWSAAVALLSWLPGLGAAAPAIGMFTIVDGGAIVIRGAHKFAATEGLTLRSDDIVHTDDKTRLARVEFTDGGALDIGRATRLWLSPRLAAPRSAQPLHLYVAEGWVKLSSTGPKLALASPRADLPDLAGVAVLRVADDASFVFLERGAAHLVERSRGEVLRSRRLREGEAFDRRSGDVGAVISRPAPDMIEAMPRSFADSLPLRAARFRDSKLEPEDAASIDYADVALWINGERMLRPAFVQRWAAQAGEARFRKPLVAELRLHPEWAPVLFAEKASRRRAAPAAPRPARPVYASPTLPLPARFAISEPPALRSASVDAERPLRPWEVSKR